MVSKTSQLMGIIDGTHVMGGSPTAGLAAYHAARGAIDKMRCRGWSVRISEVKQALRHYRVIVSPGAAEGTVRVFNPATKQELVMGMAR